MRTTKTALVGAVAAAAMMWGVPAASAVAPADRDTFELDCGGGQTLVVAVNGGHGDFTPARVVGTTTMLVPVAFGDFVFTATSPEGEVLMQESEPGIAKGGGHVQDHRGEVTCTFSETFVLPEDDPESGLPAGTTVTFSSSVTGFLTGR